jgi:hypothetical protein
MTVKVIELIVEIPDSLVKGITNETLVETIFHNLNDDISDDGTGKFVFEVNNLQLPPIEEIRVTRTNPSFVHVPTDDVRPVIHELHDEGDEIEGDEIV